MARACFMWPDAKFTRGTRATPVRRGAVAERADAVVCVENADVGVMHELPERLRELGSVDLQPRIEARQWMAHNCDGSCKPCRLPVSKEAGELRVCVCVCVCVWWWWW